MLFCVLPVPIGVDVEDVLLRAADVVPAPHTDRRRTFSN